MQIDTWLLGAPLPVSRAGRGCSCAAPCGGPTLGKALGSAGCGGQTTLWQLWKTSLLLPFEDRRSAHCRLPASAGPQVLALELSAFCPVALGGWFGALRALRNLVVASPLIALPLQLSQLAALTSITLSAKTGNDYHELTNDVHFEVPAILMPPGCLPTGLRVLRLFDHATALPEAVLVASQLSYLSVGSGSLSHNYNCSGLEGLTALRTLVVDTCSGGAPPQVCALSAFTCAE